MITNIRTFLNKINQDKIVKKQYKILCTPIHETYQSKLALTGHEFHMMQGPGVKEWNFNLKPLPPNHYLYKLSATEFRGEQQFDMILSQERYSEIQRSLMLSKQFGIPVVHIDHTEPPPGIPPKKLNKLIEMRADKHCFITEHNKVSWQGRQEDVVIPHGIDTDKFKGYSGYDIVGISVVNQFAARDVFCGWNLWQSIAKEIPMRLIGENPGISQPAKDENDLITQLSNARFFLNTSQWSPCPLSLLEAASVGLPIVSTAQQDIPRIFKHGENAFLSNNPSELIGYCKQLLNDYDLAVKMGNAARQVILDNYTIDRFLSTWNKVFDDTYIGK